MTKEITRSDIKEVVRDMILNGEIQLGLCEQPSSVYTRSYERIVTLSVKEKDGLQKNQSQYYGIRV